MYLALAQLLLCKKRSRQAIQRRPWWETHVEKHDKTSKYIKCLVTYRVADSKEAFLVNDARNPANGAGSNSRNCGSYDGDLLVVGGGLLGWARHDVGWCCVGDFKNTREANVVRMVMSWVGGQE